MKITFTKPDEEISKRINSLFPISDCFIKVSPGNVMLPRKYEKIAESIRNLTVYEDDIWLVSYPRTGSTWAQEMIWLLANKLDFKGAKEMLQTRCPLIELTALYDEDHNVWVNSAIGNTVELVEKMPRPRLVRSHLPWDLLPKDLEKVCPKIIYTARNPKDLCVSFFYYCKLVHGLKGTFDDFCELFLRGSTPIGPYLSHVIPFWQRRNESNVLFLKYEDMNHDINAIIKNCAEFLEVDFKMSDEDLEKICEHLKFDKMQSNPAVNLEYMNIEGLDKENNSNAKFIRKGKIGDWKNLFSSQMSERFDRWTEEELKGTDLKFEYE
ncbi:sulfotransferase 1E1 [Episyrphus balteatus]|uniref:sulfotransferase 1E1 n=1 Tax=Episyrphus balteatus TaxID=286459 RepID=UPI002484F781|nr:sulfotransferase 1E1 [Episyrphus balteatus]